MKTHMLSTLTASVMLTFAAHAETAQVVLNDSQNQILVHSLESEGAGQNMFSGIWYYRVESLECSSSSDTPSCHFWGLVAIGMPSTVPVEQAAQLTKLLKDIGVPSDNGVFAANIRCSAKEDEAFRCRLDYQKTE